MGFEGKNWDFVTDAGAEQGLGSPALLGLAQAAVSLEVSVCDCHCIPEDFVQVPEFLPMVYPGFWVALQVL